MTTMIGYGLLKLKNMRFKRSLKHLWQKLSRGFSDKETWNLDVTFAEFALPRLKRFRQISKKIPADLTTEKWNEILNDIEFAFTKIVDDDYYTLDSVEDNTRIEKGLKLFAEYYRNLWW